MHCRDVNMYYASTMCICTISFVVVSLEMMSFRKCAYSCTEIVFLLHIHVSEVSHRWCDALDVWVINTHSLCCAAFHALGSGNTDRVILVSDYSSLSNVIEAVIQNLCANGA